MKLVTHLKSPTARYHITLAVLLVLVAASALWRGGKSIDMTWLWLGVSWGLSIELLLRPSKKSTGLPTWLWAIAMAFTLWTILSYLHSTTANYGLDEVFRTAAGVITFLWAARTVGEGSAMEKLFNKKLVSTIAISALIAGLIGYFVYVLQPPNRFVGTFFDARFHTDYWPNAWAEYLLLAWPLILIWTLDLSTKIVNTRLRYVLFTLLNGFALACLLLSYSRASWIAFVGQLVLGGVYFWWLQSNRDDYALVIRRSVAIVIAAVVLFCGFNIIRQQYHKVQSMTEKITFSAAEGKTSATERIDFWNHSTALMTTRPLVGWGPYSFRFLQPDFQTGVLATSDHSHNVFLKLGSERGVPAMFFYIVLVLGVLLLWLWRLRQGAKITLFSVSCFIAVAGVIAHNLVDYNLQFVGIALPLWLLLGVLAAPLLTKATHRSMMARRLFELCIITALMIVACSEGKYLATTSKGRAALAAGDQVKALELFNASELQRFSRDLHLTRIQLLTAMEADSDTIEGAINRYYYQNSEDARGWRLLADFCWDIKDYECALRFYEYSYERNKRNDLGMVYTYLILMKSIGMHDAIDQMKPELDLLLNEYADAIEANTHFIALSQNVEAVVQVGNFLAELYPEDEPAYITLGARAERAAKRERNQLRARPTGLLW